MNYEQLINEQNKTCIFFTLADNGVLIGKDKTSIYKYH